MISEVYDGKPNGVDGRVIWGSSQSVQRLSTGGLLRKEWGGGVKDAGCGAAAGTPHPPSAEERVVQRFSSHAGRLSETLFGLRCHRSWTQAVGRFGLRRSNQNVRREKQLQNSGCDDGAASRPLTCWSQDVKTSSNARRAGELGPTRPKD